MNIAHHDQFLRFAVTPDRHGRVRRLLDVAIAGTAMVILSPLMLLAALLIVIESGPPVFFGQTRIGTGGTRFQMYKFRKFRPNCDQNGFALTMKDDQRLTPVGKFLALTKFDELPQLWSVLIGEMAIVGPRPESMAFAECFRGGYEQVLRFKPGLVGPSQVLFRHENCLYPSGADAPAYYRAAIFPAKARLDLDYYDNRTVISDLGWIFRAALAVSRFKPEAPPLGA